MSSNLLGLNRAQFQVWCEERGEKPFRARQMMRWMHQSGINDFALMSDVSRDFREQLSACAVIEAPPVLKDTTAPDGTRKWLFDVGTGNAIEAVYIPEGDAEDEPAAEGAPAARRYRGTLCISSQAGCALECSFCSTGRQGFNRNLTTAEIVGQLWHASRSLSAATGMERPITNVVMMGMGEPLQNYSSLIPALRVMLDDHGYGLSRRRVTVSTSGVVPMIDRLALDCPVALAVSLHAPNDSLREDLVPLNRKYPLAELLDACHRYLAHAPRDFITFEYCMLDGVNDQVEQAQELVRLVRERTSAGLACKFNLIPFNPFPASGLTRSSMAQVQLFARILSDAGIVTTIRKTRGDDIDAACGQLAGDVRDRTGVEERILRQRRIVISPSPNVMSVDRAH